MIWRIVGIVAVVIFVLGLWYWLHPWSTAVVVLSIFAAVYAWLHDHGWGRLGGAVMIAGVILAIVMLGKHYWPSGSWDKTKVPDPLMSISPDLAGEGEATLILKEGEPRKISIPPAHRWDIVPPYPSGWATNNGERDDNYNRIQIFKVVPPEKEVQLKVRIRKCLSAKDCTW